VGIDRHASTVVDHGQITAVLKRDLDECGVARHGFVHRIVDDFGKEMMQRVGVRPSDIHAGSPAHGLQPLEHFDRGGGVVCFVRRSGAHAGLAFDRHRFAALRRSRAEKIVHVLCHNPANRALFKLPRAGENENRTPSRPSTSVHAKVEQRWQEEVPTNGALGWGSV
jgi:hypothetical protein